MYDIKRATEKGPIVINAQVEKENTIIPFVTTHNPNNFNMFRVVNNHEEQ